MNSINYFILFTILLFKFNLLQFLFFSIVKPYKPRNFNNCNYNSKSLVLLNVFES